MQSASERQREQLEHKLRTKPKKEFLVPLCSILQMTDAASLKRQNCATRLTQRILRDYNQHVGKHLTEKDIVELMCHGLNIKTPEMNIVLRQYKFLLVEIFTKGPTGRISLTPVNVKNDRPCICRLKATPLISSKTINCQDCGKPFHPECLHTKHTIFQCPYCILLTMDPLNRVEKCQYIGYLKGLESASIGFLMDRKLTPHEALQIRCIRLDNYCYEGQMWPDIGRLQFNSQNIVDFKPLATNVGQKRRRDTTAIVSFDNVKNHNTINIFHELHGYPRDKYRIGNYPHLFGVYVVRKLTVNQLVKDVEKNYLPLEKSQALLKSNFMDNDVEIAEELTSLMCTLSQYKISVPVRGKYCTHFKCFDLKSMISLNESTRKWDCPCCKRKATQLLVDPILMKIIMENPKVTAVSFCKDGKKRFVMESEEESEEENAQPRKIPNTISIDLDDPQPQPVLPIQPIEKPIEIKKPSEQPEQKKEERTVQSVTSLYAVPIDPILAVWQEPEPEASKNGWIDRLCGLEKEVEQSLQRPGAPTKSAPKLSEIIVLDSDEEDQFQIVSRIANQKSSSLANINQMNRKRFNQFGSHPQADGKNLLPNPKKPFAL